MVFRTASTALFLTFLVGINADGFPSYTPDSYPDSLKDLRACRAPLNSPSLVCDPNHILNDVDNREGKDQFFRGT